MNVKKRNKIAAPGVKPVASSPRSFPPVSVAVFLITLAGMLAYGNSFNAPLIFDDLVNITDNPTILDLGNAGRVFLPTVGSSLADRPVVNFTLAVNYAISGYRVWSYHAFNLLIHILAAITLFGIIRRTLLSRRMGEKYGQVATSIAFGSSLIWLLHPMQTQAVTYITQRFESLMGMFFLMTVYCAIRSWNSSSANVWRLLAFLTFILGAGSKEVIVVAPFVALAWEWIFIRSSWEEVWRRSWRLYAGLGAGILLLGLLVNVAAVHTSGFGAATYAPWEYWQTQPQAILHYLRLAVWPDRLCFDYGRPMISFGEAMPSAAMLAMMLTGSLWLFYKKSPLGFPALAFFLILAPTSIMPLKDPVCEYRMYLPMAALSTAFVFMVHLAGCRLQERFSPPAVNRLPSFFWIAILLASLPLGVLTYERNQVYRQGLIWRDTVQKAPQNSRAHLNLGVELDQAGKPYEAIRHFEEAIRLRPDYAAAPANLGAVLIRLGKTDDAIRYLKEAIRLEPGYAEAYSNLGVALGRSGRLDEAVAAFGEALRLKPDSAEGHSNLGLVLGYLGRKQESIGHLQEALRLKPDYQAARMNLELLMKTDGR
jgi:tetratricopeptide (TPR) repeat protein